MKTKTRTTKGIAIVITALTIASVGHAQLKEPPKPGTYYSAKDFEWKPPWPFNPHPELPVVEIEPGKFLVDDTGVPDTPEQAEARKRWQEADALAKAIAADPVLAAAAQGTSQTATPSADTSAPYAMSDAASATAGSAVAPKPSDPGRSGPTRAHRSSPACSLSRL